MHVASVTNWKVCGSISGPCSLHVGRHWARYWTPHFSRWLFHMCGVWVFVWIVIALDKQVVTCMVASATSVRMYVNGWMLACVAKRFEQSIRPKSSMHMQSIHHYHLPQSLWLTWTVHRGCLQDRLWFKIVRSPTPTYTLVLFTRAEPGNDLPPNRPHHNAVKRHKRSTFSNQYPPSPDFGLDSNLELTLLRCI